VLHEVLQALVCGGDVAVGDRGDEAHQRAVAAAAGPAVPDHLELGGEIVGHAAAALFEPVIDQLLGGALLDHRAVDGEGAVDGAGDRDLGRVEAVDLPAADRQADLRRVDAGAARLVRVPGDEKLDRRRAGPAVTGGDVVVGPEGARHRRVERLERAVAVVDLAREQHERRAVGQAAAGIGHRHEQGRDRGRQRHRQRHGGRGAQRQHPRRDRRQPVGVEIDRLRQRQRIGPQPLQPDRHGEQDADAGQKDHPALEEVQEAFGMLDPVGIDQDADHADAERIHEHRDRRRREQHHRLVPQRPAIEDGEEVRERQDREQVAQPRTGLGHLQLVDAEIDDVAVEIDRDPGEIDEPDADHRGHALQEDGQLPVERLRQRQHEHQMQHRRPVAPPARPAEAQQDHAHGPDDEGIGDDVADLHQVAEQRQNQPQRQNRDAGTPIDRRRRVGRRRPAQLAQKQIERDQRDQRPVAVLRRAPGLPQLGKPENEQRQRRHAKRQKKTEPQRINKNPAPCAADRGKARFVRHMTPVPCLPPGNAPGYR